MFGSRFRSAYLIGAAACWGLGTALSKYALGGWAASSLLPFQLACSVLLLGAVLIATGTSVRGISHPVRIGALGVLDPGIAYALGLAALARIDASVSVVIWATEPVIIVVLAVVFLRERVPVSSVLCLALAMAGVALIVGAPSAHGSATGVALTFAAVSACALYSVLLRGMEILDGTLPVVFLQQTSALVFGVLVLLVVQGRHIGPIEASASQVFAAVAAGALYYGVAFLLYVAGLRRTSAHRAGMSLTLIPVFGLLSSAWLLGETMGIRQLSGSLLVIGAMVVLATRRPRSGARADAATRA